jgi:hypothetical protein
MSTLTSLWQQNRQNHLAYHSETMWRLVGGEQLADGLLVLKLALSRAIVFAGALML